jgi:hypothetical protein
VPEICHRPGIAAPRHHVYEEFATKGGLAEFRPPVDGEPESGGKLNSFLGGAIAEQTETDLSDFPVFNVVYAAQCPGETEPARTTVGTTVRANFAADIAPKLPSSPIEPGELSHAQAEQ